MHVKIGTFANVARETQGVDGKPRPNICIASANV